MVPIRGDAAKALAEVNTLSLLAELVARETVADINMALLTELFCMF